MKRATLLTYFFILYCLTAVSQTIKPLNIGDKVPDLEIGNLINYPKKKVKLSEFKGKLIILDFWELTCLNCIRALPKIESLQKKFKDKVQVINITRLGTQDQITSLLQRIPVTRNFRLPIALNNILLRKYFPFEFVSHVVWIDEKGIVKAITGTDYVDDKNIQSILDGENIDWPVKKDVSDFIPNQPLLDFVPQNSIDRPDFKYYSALMGRINGIDAAPTEVIDSARRTITRNYFNFSILGFGEIILTGFPGYTDPKYIILEVTDTSRYLFRPEKHYRAEWENKNTFCYTISLPLGISQERAKTIIKSDLSRWLDILYGVSIKKEKRLINCLALVRTNSDNKLLTTKGGKQDNNLDNNDNLKSLTNIEFSSLIGFLQGIDGIPFVTDETGIPYDMNIDIDLTIGSIQNISNWQTELQRYGLNLVPAVREIEMYVISEKDWKK